MSKLKVGDLSKKSTDILKDNLQEEESVFQEPPFFEENEETNLEEQAVLEEEKLFLNKPYTVINREGEVEPLTSNEKETVLYSKEELEETVKKVAGSFYGTYISHFHPGQLEKGGEGIRTKAVLEIINFTKVLLQELKKEG